jgi:hypothetical protein|tara:strand:- start:59 stop:922 length:864 start_codon:yes stop_codon:yes gene_type:complete
MKSDLGRGKDSSHLTYDGSPVSTVFITPDFSVACPPSYPRKEPSPKTLEEAIRISATTATVLRGLTMKGEDDGKIPRLADNADELELDAVHIFEAGLGRSSPTMAAALRVCGEENSGDQERGEQVVQKAAVKPNSSKLYNPTVAKKLSDLLTEYDRQVVGDAVQLRNYVTNKLLEASDSGKVSEKIKALELLGKISDVGLFSEKTEIHINQTAGTLEHALKDKINRLMGVYGDHVVEADFEEVDITPPEGADIPVEEVELDGDEERSKVSESGGSGIQQTQEDSEPS